MAELSPEEGEEDAWLSVLMNFEQTKQLVLCPGAAFGRKPRGEPEVAVLSRGRAVRNTPASAAGAHCHQRAMGLETQSRTRSAPPAPCSYVTSCPLRRVV